MDKKIIREVLTEPTVKGTEKLSLLVLVMMIKNEEARIEVSFDSVKNFTNTFVILDTGSTDKTIGICKEYCKKNNITLFLKETVFVNFQETRNMSLDFADEVLPRNKYLLFLDCNDELRHGDRLVKFTEQYNGPATGFYLKQNWWTGDKFDSYFNIRMAISHKTWRYVGVVHEYIATKRIEDNIHQRLEDVVLFQDRTKDDDKSANRFKRDKEMLFKEYLRNPTESRTLFYLAQTCGCLSLPNEAYQYYLLRIKQIGFVEEIYHSYIRLGELAMVLQHPWEESESWFLKAYAHSSRAEPLNHLAIRYLQYNSFGERTPDYMMAYMYSSMACKLCFPLTQLLFIDKKVYQHDRWINLGKSAYHVQQYKEGKEAIINALMFQDNVEHVSILIDYLKMDKTITKVVNGQDNPHFKASTYIIHDQVKLIPLVETNAIEYKQTKKDVLHNALTVMIGKK